MPGDRISQTSRCQDIGYHRKKQMFLVARAHIPPSPPASKGQRERQLLVRVTGRSFQILTRALLGHLDQELAVDMDKMQRIVEPLPRRPPWNICVFVSQREGTWKGFNE